MNLFELTYFDENGTIRSTDSGTPAWKHSGNTFRNEELGFSFDLENTETELFLASASVKETKSDRIRSLIFEPGMLSPASEGGELILPFGNGVRCRCSGKPEAEALLPLFNRLGGSGNLSLLASVARDGSARMLIAEEGRFDADIRLRTAFGPEKRYSADFVFFLREYPDQAIQTDLRLIRKTFSGGLPELAEIYRGYVMEKRKIPALADKMRDNPELEYSSKAVMVRLRLAVKQINACAEQTPELQPPMMVFMTFGMVENLVQEFSRRKSGPVDFNLVGWNWGGHDGAFPQVFPVEERLGGETAMRTLLERTHALGYAMSIHDNYFDMYSIADRFSPDGMNRNHDGSPTIGGIWGGGQAYQICPEYACRFYRENRKTIGTLPLKGAYYLDVFGCAQLTPCFSPEHPVTRGENAALWKDIFRSLQTEYGVTMSEGSREWSLPEVDRSYAVCNAPGISDVTTVDGRALPLFDEEVPLYEMVYHGLVLYNTYRTDINHFPGDPLYLQNLALGGIPLYYYHQSFLGSGWKTDLRYSTADALRRDVGKICRASEDMKKLDGLQTVFIRNLIRHTPSLIETVYAEGTRVFFNLGSKELRIGEFLIPPFDFLRV